MKSNLFGIKIDCLTKAELVNRLKAALESSAQTKVAKLNAEILLKAIKDNKFKEALSGFELVIADGVGVQWAAKYLSIPLSEIPIWRQVQAVIQMVYSGASLVLYPKYCTSPIKERFPGIEAFKLMLQVAEEKKVEVFFFGGREETTKKGVEDLKAEFPGLVIHYANGYEDKAKAVELINQTKAKLLFVGLGAPEQEEWMSAHLGELKNVKVAVGEGGTIDRIANPVAKAPKWMSTLGVEWLWRMFANKNRTTGAGNRFLRVIKSVIGLILVSVSYKIKHGNLEAE